MATINSSDNGSTRETEVTRRNRDDYKNNETEMTKRHQKEIRRLTEQFNSEIEKLKKNHESHLNDLKKSSAETFSKRDHRYQQDVEGLRNLHRKQVQESAANANRTLDATRSVSETELELGKNRNHEALRSQAENFQQTIRDQENTVSKTIEEMRAEQKNARESYHKKQNAAHEKEMKQVTENFQKEIQEAQTQDRTYRKASTAQMRNMQIQLLQDKKDASENLHDVVASERLDHVANEQALRKGFREQLGRVRDRYADGMEEGRMTQEQAAENVRDEVRGRVDGQQRRLEQEVRDLKNQNARDHIGRKRLADSEIQSVRYSMGENVKEALRTRDESLHASNRRRAEDMSELDKDHSRDLVEINRDYLERMHTQNDQGRTALDQLKSDYRARNDHARITADSRVKHVMSNTELEKDRMGEHYDNSKQMMTDSHREELSQIRSITNKQKVDAIEQMKDFMRRQEVGHAEKMAAQQTRFDRDMARLNDELVKQKRENDEALKRLTSQLDRQKNAEIEALNIQNQAKIRKAETQHHEEMRTVNMRNQERMDQLLTNVKKA
jgi:hypothetical protein